MARLFAKLQPSAGQKIPKIFDHSAQKAETRPAPRELDSHHTCNSQVSADPIYACVLMKKAGSIALAFAAIRLVPAGQSRSTAQSFSVASRTFFVDRKSG